MSDRIAIMREGRFEQIGTPDEIYARPRSRFVAEFMGEVNLFEIMVEGDVIAATDGLTAAPGMAAALGMGRGERATLMVRPEAARFLAPGAEADMSIPGRLHAEYILGSRIQYEIDLESGAKLTVETLRDDRFGGVAGDAVRLGWDRDHCHLIREG